MIKEAGWKIPGLVGAKEFIPPRLLRVPNLEGVKLYSTWLKPPPGAAGPATLKGQLSDDELKELGITAKRLQVMTIVKYDLDDRPFCYVVNYRSTYTLDGLRFYDEDGDGRFDLVETGTGASPEFVPRIPGRTQH